MDLSFRQVRAIDAGIWVGALAACDAAKLPGAPLKIAGPHVVLLDQPVWNGTELKARFAGVSVLALGRGEAAIYLSADAAARANEGVAANPVAAAPPQAEVAPQPARVTLAGDDEAFIVGLEEIGTDMVRIGRALMARIRALYPGALSRLDTPRKFVETPDNFWGVEIRPRKGAIKLTVRANEERLREAGPTYVSERPPAYFAIKI